MAIDLNKEIRRSVDTGKVLFGAKSAEKNVLSGKARIVVLTENAERDINERLRYYAELGQVKCLTFDGSGLELGSVCGKPFTISCLTVLDAGKSKLDEAEAPKKKSRSNE